MTGKSALVITSISKPNPALASCAEGCLEHDVDFIVIGDVKSPSNFILAGCDFWSIERQRCSDFNLAKSLPEAHYARKNLGYLIAMSKGAEIIIETDDDNYPLPDFWDDRKRNVSAHALNNMGWVNVYKYFTKSHIWPRGFALEHIQDISPILEDEITLNCPIQQGLSDENPDVDAIYRLTLPLPIIFDKSENIALGNKSFCPFNSQNTTWFREAFPLLYLPSYCSFRMTDIWRSFVAQRIAWTCGWPILFHHSTVRQDRNNHNLMSDFRDEISGYNNNEYLCKSLRELNLEEGTDKISVNMILCYEKLIEKKLIGQNELKLLEAWTKDISALL